MAIRKCYCPYNSELKKGAVNRLPHKVTRVCLVRSLQTLPPYPGPDRHRNCREVATPQPQTLHRHRAPADGKGAEERLRTWTRTPTVSGDESDDGGGGRRRWETTPTSVRPVPGYYRVGVPRGPATQVLPAVTAPTDNFTSVKSTNRRS